MPLSFGIVFYGVFFVFTTGANLKDKTWVFPIILLLTVILQTTLGIFMIPTRGATAAAWIAFTGYGFLSLSTLTVNQRILPIQFPWGRVLRVALISVLILYLSSTPYFSSTFTSRVLLIGAFPLLLLLTGYLDKGERGAIRRTLLKR